MLGGHLHRHLYRYQHLQLGRIGRACSAGGGGAKAPKYGALGTRFRLEPVKVETAGVYGESTAALIPEIGRRITEATGESRDPLAGARVWSGAAAGQCAQNFDGGQGKLRRRAWE